MPTERALIRKESVVYAQVLLEATQNAGTSFEVSGQLQDVLALTRGNIELRSTLCDASLSADARISIINEVFSNYDEALRATLAVMVKRNNLGLLAKLSEEFSRLAEDALGAVFIDVTTALALDDGLRSAIKTKYAAQFGREVLLREHIDAGIVGGIVLKAHGISIDASVVSQLEHARVVLSHV
jgi:F-type H+-transporting ATPase subunit delta